MTETLRRGVAKTGNTYRVQRTVNGQTVRASFATLAIANDFSKAVDEAKRSGLALPSQLDRRFNPSPSPTTRVLLRDWVEYSIAIAQQKSQSSIENAHRNRRRYSFEAADFFGSIAVTDVTAEMICIFRDRLADVHNLERTTAKARLGVVRRGLEEAKSAGLIAGNPAEGVGPGSPGALAGRSRGPNPALCRRSRCERSPASSPRSSSSSCG